MEYTFTLHEIGDIAEKVIKDVSNKTLLFYGDMGVGKTTLIKEIAKKLGVKETLNSPTYSIINEYEFNNEKLFHFDFYRIKEEKEAFDIGFEEYFYSDHWSFIEWPQIIEHLIAVNKTKIELTKNPDGSRTINILPMN